MDEIKENQAESTEIVLEGIRPSHFTMIPNAFARGIMAPEVSVNARWLYVYLRSVVGSKASCWQGTRAIAKGSGLSVGAVSSAKKELIDSGMIVVQRRSHQSDLVRLVDVWKRNAEGCSGDEQGVHHMNGGVQEVNGGVHHMNERIYIEEETEKKTKEARSRSIFGMKESGALILKELPKSHSENLAMTVALGEFVEFRWKVKKAKLTPQACRRMAAKLAEMAPDDARASLLRSVDRGWSDVFPIEKNDAKKKGEAKGMSAQATLGEWGY